MKQAILFLLALLFNPSNSSSQTWQRIQLMPSLHGAPAMTDAVFYQDSCVLMTSDGPIIHTDDFFQSYNIDSTYKGKTLEAMSFPTHDTGYITSAYVRGGLLKTVDRGNTWNPMPTGALQGSVWGDALVFTNPDSGYAAHSDGGCFRTTRNAGVTWSLCSLTTQCPKILSFHFTNDSTGFLLSNDNFSTSGNLHIYKTIDYGNNWAEIVALPFLGYGDMFFIDDTTVITCSSQRIGKSIDGGYNFTTVYTSSDFQDSYGYFRTHSISFANHDTGYVAYQTRVYKTYDAGNTWQRTDFAFDTTDEFNEIYFIKAISGTKVMVGCGNGNIYKTETGGGVWSGIKETEQENKVAVYPNPATKKLTVTTTATMLKSTITVTNTTGAVVLQTTLTNTNKTEIDISSLPAGLYFLSLQDEWGRVVRRFVKE